MSAIPKSRHAALVDALKNVKKAQVSDMDAAFELIATELLKCLVPVTHGTGAPSEPFPSVSQVGDLYCDDAAGAYYRWNGSAWVGGV